MDPDQTDFSLLQPGIGKVVGEVFDCVGPIRFDCAAAGSLCRVTLSYSSFVDLVILSGSFFDDSVIAIYFSSFDLVIVLCSYYYRTIAPQHLHLANSSPSIGPA